MNGSDGGIFKPKSGLHAQMRAFESLKPPGWAME
jgi:hypothetical protein